MCSLDHFAELDEHNANFVHLIMLSISCMRPIALCNKIWFMPTVLSVGKCL